MLELKEIEYSTSERESRIPKKKGFIYLIPIYTYIRIGAFGPVSNGTTVS